MRERVMEEKVMGERVMRGRVAVMLENERKTVVLTLRSLHKFDFSLYFTYPSYLLIR
jgi:hypothetical protein